MSNDNSGCVQLLREAPGLKFNLKNEAGCTPLMVAAAVGNADSLQILLSVPQPELNLTVTGSSGLNVAWYAVKGREDRDKLRRVELLCEDPRVDWNTRNGDGGNTPLLYCLKCQEEMARIIIRNPRVDLNVQNNDGEFPETIAR